MGILSERIPGPNFCFLGLGFHSISLGIYLVFEVVLAKAVATKLPASVKYSDPAHFH